MAATSTSSSNGANPVRTISLGPFTISVSLAGVNGIDVAVQNSAGQKVQQTIVMPDISSKAPQLMNTASPIPETTRKRKRRKKEDIDSDACPPQAQEWMDTENDTVGADVLKLPVELQEHIFSLLPLRTVATLNLVCTKWRSLAEDEKLWHRFFTRRFGGPRMLEMTWRQRYLWADRKASFFSLQGPGFRDELLWASRHGFFRYLESVLAYLYTEEHRRVQPATLAELLYIASVDGQREVVDLLLSLNVDVDLQCKSHGRTTLQYAAKYGNTELVKLLLEHSANADMADDHGWTPLLFASKYGHLRITERLLEHGATVEAVNDEGETALMLAATDGHVNVINLLIQHGAQVEHEDKDKWTALLFAVQNNHFDAVKQLVDVHGASIDAVAYDGWTALIIAACDGFTDIATFLLERGAAVDHPDNQGATPLLHAARKGHLNVIEALLKYGANVNAASEQKITALMEAAAAGYADIVGRLLECSDIKVNCVSDKGNTALMWACKGTQIQMVKRIIEAGAEVNVQNNNFQTPLLVAIREIAVDVVKLLIDAGAELNSESNADGSVVTPLSYACKQGPDAGPNVQSLVALLIDRGADVEGTDKGLSPLHEAVRSGNLGVVRMLLKAGAIADKRNSEGDLPAHYTEDKEILVALGYPDGLPEEEKRKKKATKRKRERREKEEEQENKTTKENNNNKPSRKERKKEP